VETVGTGAAVASIADALPKARFVHVVRDGRDTASADWVRSGWEDPFYWLDRWAERFAAADAAAGSIASARCVTLEFEQIASDEHAAATGLRRIAVSAPDADVAKAAAGLVASARIGRWRQEVSEVEHGSFDRAYARLFKSQAAAITCALLDEDAAAS
jgi:hypothetical protein